jgi:hypothetical protein
MAKAGFRSTPPRVNVAPEQTSPTPVPSKEVDELRRKRQGLNEEMDKLRKQQREAPPNQRQKLQEEIAKRRTMVRSLSLQISNAEAV